MTSKADQERTELPIGLFKLSHCLLLMIGLIPKVHSSALARDCPLDELIPEVSLKLPPEYAALVTGILK